MARRRGFPARSPYPKRLNAWSVGPISATQAITSTTPVLWTAGVVLESADEATIVRIRGEALIYLVASSATNAGGFTGAMGIGIATSAAFAVGQTAVPTPLTESDWDGWMWHRFFTLQSAGPIDSGVAADIDQTNPTTAALRVEIDSKAMRKLQADYVVYGAVEMGVEAGTADARFSADSRMLFKLS